MAFRVNFLPRARLDVRAEGDYLGTRNKRAESRWRLLILRATEELERDPLRYPRADEAAELGIGLRQMLLGRGRISVFRVLFTVDGDTVNVHRVRHASQDWLDEDDV